MGTHAPRGISTRQTEQIWKAIWILSTDVPEKKMHVTPAFTRWDHVKDHDTGGLLLEDSLLNIRNSPVALSHGIGKCSESKARNPPTSPRKLSGRDDRNSMAIASLQERTAHSTDLYWVANLPRDRGGVTTAALWNTSLLFLNIFWLLSWIKSSSTGDLQASEKGHLLRSSLIYSWCCSS